MDLNHMHLVVSVTSRHFSGLESAFFFISGRHEPCSCYGLVFSMENEIWVFVGVCDRFGYSGEHTALYREATSAAVSTAGR